jgi:hypothetical protein
MSTEAFFVILHTPLSYVYINWLQKQTIATVYVLITNFDAQIIIYS